LLELAGGQPVQLAMFRLPENGANISCTLTRTMPAPATDVSGLASRDSFMDEAARIAGAGDALTLVDVPGLKELCAGLPPERADALMRKIGASLQQSGAAAAGRLSDNRFGAVAPLRRPLGLAKLIGSVLTEGGHALAVKEKAVSLQGPGLSAEQRMLALRYVVERFTERGQVEASDGDIASAFGALMEETQNRLAAMTQTVGEGAFQIAYQPISDLKTGKLSHYEALSRFTNKEGTADTVKFIEALGIADAFDLAVASKVLALLDSDAPKSAEIAFNVSGRTIASPASFGLLAALLARRRALAPRVLIEITETADIGDLAEAGKAIGALRAMGYRVGLDDFGAGAASLNYLHAFPIDFVKFDGAMIQKIGASERDDALLAGLAKLCAEMGVTTIAEWIEDDAMARKALALGFQHGQGRYLGAPLLEIPRDAVAAGRRKGVSESWG
jgi:EAL domain-containing protein (putative c-di-GMP-specific phosphodiesterase class I)